MRKTLVRKGLREIWDNKAQYIFLIVILGMGIATFNSFQNMMDSRWATFDAIYEEARYMDLEVSFQYGVTADEDDVDAILTDPAVAGDIDDAEYRLTYDAFLDYKPGPEERTVRGKVIGYDAYDNAGQPREPEVNRPLFYDDDPSGFSAPGALECYVEHAFAEYYDISAGDTLDISVGGVTTTLTVLEDVNVPNYIWVIEEGALFPTERSLGIIMMPMETARTLYSGGEGDEAAVNDIVLTLAGGSDRGDVRAVLEDLFEGEGIPVKTISKDENPARLALKADLEGDSDNINVFPGIIFAVSGFGLFMTLRRMIQTHRSQIGVFKSLGVPDRVVMMYFSIIGLFVALFSIIVGVLLSIPLDIAMNGMLVSLQDWAVREYVTAYDQYFVSAAVSVVLCLFCTILPARAALKMKPIDAIQTREGVQYGKKRKKGGKDKAGKSSRGVGGEVKKRRSRLPVPLKLSLRNMARKPSRTITTVLGVALALSLFMSMLILSDAFTDMLETDEENNQWDYEVVLTGFMPMNTTEGWGDGTDEFNRGFFLPTSVERGGDSEDGVIYAFEDTRRSLKMSYQDGGWRDGELSLSRFMAERLGADVGDSVTITIPRMTGPMSFATAEESVRVSGIHDNHLGFYAFMDAAALGQLTNLTGSMNYAYVHTPDGGEDPALENSITTTPGVSSVTYIDERGSYLEDALDLFAGVVSMMALVSVILAMAIVYNLFMINAQEKKREYATMKTLGTSLRRISYLIFIEGVYVIVLSLIVGTLGGYGMAWFMLSQTSEDFGAMNFNIGFSATGIAASAGLIILVVLMVSALTIRYISKINIANVIRDRST